MSLPRHVLALLCLLFAATSAFKHDFSSWLVPVTKMEQLWRYQVGPSGVHHGVTPGEDFICLRDWKGKFIHGTPHGPFNDEKDCFDHERFVVTFLGGNLTSIQRKDGHYLRCNEPDAGASKTLIEEAKFIFYINDEEDKLYLYSPSYGKIFGAYHENRLLTCSSHHPGGSEAFYGWKIGPKASWQATDEWVVIGTFDNRDSKSTGRFTYSKTVGVEKVKESPEGAGASATSEADASSFGEYFSAKCSTSIQIDWSQESSDTWSKATTTEASIEVPPGVATTLYQAVGTYGIFTAKSNYFRTEDFDSNGFLISQRPFMPVT